MLAKSPAPLRGRSQPRIAPPTPAVTDLDGFLETARHCGIELMPHQIIAARYVTALAPDGRWLYREIAEIMSRQNGKTKPLRVLIVDRLLDGRRGEEDGQPLGARIMHTAQDRNLPREVFGWVAEFMWENHSDLFPMRNGRPTRPRYANGQEEVLLTNGGVYSIVAPTGSGARGPSRDLVLMDEVRESQTTEFTAAARPTTTASKNPQHIYLSNAGDDESVVLNALRDRAGKDPALAYLEWSADPKRTAGDIEGWLEGNPAVGWEVGEMGSIMETLEADYRADSLAGTLNIFETEHLCRWVVTMRERLVDEFAWKLCQATELPKPTRSAMGLSTSPDGTRGAAVMAWQSEDGLMNIRLVADVTGTPVDAGIFGEELKAVVQKRRVGKVGYDPMTDAALAKFFVKPKPISGNEWANASALFVNLVKAGKLRWMDCESVGDDLTWTARKAHDESGSFQGVRAKDDRPIPAALAAIRAVSLAFTHKAPSLRVY